MNPFSFQGHALFVEEKALSDIAMQFGTPTYVYSSAALTAAFKAYDRAFSSVDHLICYAVKANANLSILKHFATLGAGFDIVSGGELARVLAAGGQPDKIVFSGVGKTAEEMEEALEAGILCFNIESINELERLAVVAKTNGVIAPISIRVNPDVDAKTHPYISTGLKDNKFGVAYEEAFELYQRAAELPSLSIQGIDCHIGSQLTTISPFVDAVDRVLALVDRLTEAGIVLKHLDIGGGVGICYDEEQPPVISEYAQAILARLEGRSFKIICEPGRSLVGNAGALLTQVHYLKAGKEKNFAIVDAAMNDLMRPALYEAYHRIEPIYTRPLRAKKIYQIVGPVCESGDFLGHDRALALEEGDCLAILSAGAYGFSMSSNYNTRPRAAEVMVSGSEVRLIRARETVEQLMMNELDCLR